MTKVKRVCELCGKDFEAVVAEVNRGRAKYCSQECRMESCIDNKYAQKDIDVQMLIDLYVNKIMSTLEINKVTGVSLSTVRSRLLHAGVLRTQTEAQLLAGRQGKKSHNKGKTRLFSDETRAKIKASKIKWADKNAKGYSLKQTGYYEVTRGANKGRPLHDVIAEIKIGRKLEKGEHVHHIDGNKQNNEPENLQVLTASEHMRLHANNRKMKRRSNGCFC